MTQEEKNLVFIVLCEGFPYGVKCSHPYGCAKMVNIDKDGDDIRLAFDTPDDNDYPLDNRIKPYLRPMSSMTEEEKKEWHATFDTVYDLVPGGDPDSENDYDDNWHEEPGIESYDYLNSIHIDYRGLIPKGLALEAPEDLYRK